MHCPSQCKMIVTMENSLAIHQKIKYRLITWLRIPFLSIYSKELKVGTQTDICTLMFKAALSTIAKKWRHPKCPSTDERISKMWCVCLCMSMCTCIYNSILLVTLYIIRLPNMYNGVIFNLKKEVNHSTCHTCMSLKDHYAKRNKPDKNNKYCLIPLKWNTQGSQIQSQGVGRKEWEVNGTGFQTFVV